MPVKNPCVTCLKPVAINHRAIKCDHCDYWIHIKCNFTSVPDYNALIEKEDFKWCCHECLKLNEPFSELSDELLQLTLQGKNILNSDIIDSNDDNTRFFRDIETISLNEEDEGHQSNQCLYYSLSDLNKIKLNENSLSCFHLNIASLKLHFDELAVYS